MQAFFFGAGPRRLYAAFHDADSADAAPPAAVLLCGPHGQEGVRAHRLLRVLADRLARQGMPAMRFDPVGSGDAEGDDQDLSWDGWRSDTLAASAELARRCPGRVQVWVGARLGATVAVQAAQAAIATGTRPAPVALVLCEPVTEGRTYLRELAEATVVALEASFSIKDPAWRRRLADDPDGLAREGLGFALGDALVEALAALQPDQVRIPADIPTTVIRPTVPRSALAPVPAGTRVQVEAVPYEFDWTAEEALNTAIVPHGLLQRLVDAVSSGGAR